MELENQKHEDFAQYFVFDEECRGHLTKSAEKAGFKKSAAANMGSAVRKRPEVAKRIDELQQERRQRIFKEAESMKYSAIKVFDEINEVIELGRTGKNGKLMLDAIKLKSELLGLKETPSLTRTELGLNLLSSSKDEEKNVENFVMTGLRQQVAH